MEIDETESNFDFDNEETQIQDMEAFRLLILHEAENLAISQMEQKSISNDDN